MAWIDLVPGTAQLGLKPNGVLGWNTTLQLIMGDPTWVDFMWESNDRTLGVRAVNSSTGMPVVKDPASSTYKIDSAGILTAAGISVDEIVSAEPDSWFRANRDEGDWFGLNPIYYITLPEP